MDLGLKWRKACNDDNRFIDTHIVPILRQKSAASILFLSSFLLPATALFANGEITAFSTCTIGSATGSVDAQCATLSVPLDPQKPDGDTIDLHVAKLAAQTRKPKADAFTLLAGGPGQSATESFPAVSFAFRHIRRDRDIILLDQRGTGASNKLDCPNPGEDDDTSNLFFDAQKTEDLSRQCREVLDVDPRFFSTSVAVKDLELLRQALNIPQWNIYGVSYGTRVGLHYLRRYPNNVRSIILDAVVPPEKALGPEVALVAQQSLLRMFDRCESNDGCHEAFPNLRTGTLALLERLKKQPVSIQYENISTGELSTMEFSDKHLAVTLRLMSYSAHGTSILPSMLYDAIEHDNFASLARQVQLQISALSDTLAGGMHSAVVCTEDEPFLPDDFDTSVLDKTYLGSELLLAMQSTCRQWDQGVIDDDFHSPVKSDKPAMVLSGTDDPITPPAYGDMIVKHLDNAVHIVNENQGHMQAALGCTPLLIAEFVNKASVNELPLDCLERIRAPAFFIDANGPLP